MVQDAEFRAKAEQQGAYEAYMGPSELAEFTRLELEHWGKVVREAGIKVE